MKTGNHSAAESSHAGQLMYVRCAACGDWLDVKPGHMNQISHSLCPACFQKEMDRIDECETASTVKKPGSDEAQRP